METRACGAGSPSPSLPSGLYPAHLVTSTPSTLAASPFRCQQHVAAYLLASLFLGPHRERADSGPSSIALIVLERRGAHQISPPGWAGTSDSLSTQRGWMESSILLFPSPVSTRAGPQHLWCVMRVLAYDSGSVHFCCLDVCCQPCILPLLLWLALFLPVSAAHIVLRVPPLHPQGGRWSQRRIFLESPCSTSCLPLG